MNPQTTLLHQQLDYLRLPFLKAQYAQLAQQAAEQNGSHADSSQGTGTSPHPSLLKSNDFFVVAVSLHGYNDCASIGCKVCIKNATGKQFLLQPLGPGSAKVSGRDARTALPVSSGYDDNAEWPPVAVVGAGGISTESVWFAGRIPRAGLDQPRLPTPPPPEERRSARFRRT